MEKRKSAMKRRRKSILNRATGKRTPIISAECIPNLCLFAYKELSPCVVYTYYDENGEPIYTGKSVNFYDRHHFHIDCDPYGNEIKYVGMRFYDNPSEMELAELYWIQQLQPKYNKAGKYDSNFINISFKDFTEEFIVREDEMIECWVNENFFIDWASSLSGIEIKSYKRNWGFPTYLDCASKLSLTEEEYAQFLCDNMPKKEKENNLL